MEDRALRRGNASDYVALLALFAVNAAMIFLGWLMELLNPPDRARTCSTCALGSRSANPVHLRRWRPPRVARRRPRRSAATSGESRRPWPTLV
jgi:hypothetical protein